MGNFQSDLAKGSLPGCATAFKDVQHKPNGCLYRAACTAAPYVQLYIRSQLTPDKFIRIHGVQLVEPLHRTALAAALNSSSAEIASVRRDLLLKRMLIIISTSCCY